MSAHWDGGAGEVRPAKLYNAAGEVLIDLTDPGRPVALAAAGRLVAPGQPVASAWGNTTFDQTQNVFQSAADRDAQWPAPKDGARCFTLDKGYEWVRRAGVWVDPAGYWIQAWQAIYTASAGGIVTGNYPQGAFGAVPVVHVQNGDLSAGTWGAWANYPAGTTVSAFAGAMYNTGGGTMPNASVRLNVIAIGARP